MICLITDGFSNGEDPLPIAQDLKADNVTIITFGIESGNYAELNQLSSEPGNEHTFLLDSFAQFESLARKALHVVKYLMNDLKKSVVSHAFIIICYCKFHSYYRLQNRKRDPH